MTEEIFFVHDDSKEKLDKLLDDFDLILNLEERSKAKFMKNFTLALIQSARK
ncbi:hypothetical protein J4438_00290 [Candidatus Woesearchaeota archaeon]|nr:hypothetical protein [Candidatus Woesearchaeota archaeon]